MTGNILLEGTELTRLSNREMRAVRGRRIGYVPQSPAALRLMEDCGFALCLRKHGKPTSRIRPRRVFGPVCSKASSYRARRTFSRGAPGNSPRARRTAAADRSGDHAQARVTCWPDEPTSALDAITQAAVLRLFAELNRRLGTSILFISHDLLSVAALSQRVDILHEGVLVESGPPEQIFLRAPSSVYEEELVAAMPTDPLRR